MLRCAILVWVANFGATRSRRQRLSCKRRRPSTRAVWPATRGLPCWPQASRCVRCSSLSLCLSLSLSLSISLSLSLSSVRTRQVSRRCSQCDSVMCSSRQCGVDTVLNAELALSSGANRIAVCSLCFPGFKRKLLYKAKLVRTVLREPVHSSALCLPDV